MSTQPLGPFCQSCGMALEHPEDFGTDATGYRVNAYCRFCYQDGGFTDPHLSMAERRALLTRKPRRIPPASL